jgi:LemA protein
VENYPQLKSDAHFRTLQLELANTEDRLAAARRFYNGNVREMNQMCDAFPTNLLAGMFGFERATYFELSSDAERVVPRATV